MSRRFTIILAVLAVGLGLIAPGAASAVPRAHSAAAAVDGMLTAHGRHDAPAVPPVAGTGRARAAAVAADDTAALGDCELLDQQAPTSAPHCRPTPPSGTTSCSGYTSQTTPPATIRVLVRTGATTYEIDPVDFMTYVENVLPNEWLASWDGDALKAGAVAVKSYAWYWVTHYGGFVGSTPSSSSCFDVTDDQDFQVYRANSATDRTNAKVAESWPVVARRNGQVVQTLYRDAFTSPSEACGTGANGTTMSQYGSQNCNEANTGWKYNEILQLYYGGTLQLSSTQQLRTQHDFTFEATSTPATFNAGRWTIADGYPTQFSLGRSGDVPVVSTSGDGFATIGVYRPSTSTFYQGNILGQAVSAHAFGRAGDVPVADHYNGLTQPTQLAVFRPTTGVWYFLTPGGATATAFGRSGDVPVPGRWLAAGADSLAVYRPSNGTWYVSGGGAIPFGSAGDIPAPADYNGDGFTDIAVYRPSTSTFYVRGVGVFPFGRSGDVPVTGDFTGDGSADIAVYRPSTGMLYVRGGGAYAVGSGTPIGAAPFRG